MKPLIREDELGLERWCYHCEEWLPLDDEFWYFETRGGSRVAHCRTCRRSAQKSHYSRLNDEVAAVRAERHRCEECLLVKTRRPLCHGCAGRTVGPLTVAMLERAGLAPRREVAA